MLQQRVMTAMSLALRTGIDLVAPLLVVGAAILSPSIFVASLGSGSGGGPDFTMPR